MSSPLKPRIKAIWFDFMGTCLDWHTTISSALPPSLPSSTRSNFALEWRQAYFEANDARRLRGESPEDIDITHRRVLDDKLSHPDTPAEVAGAFTEADKERAVRAWHEQKAWGDVAPALEGLRGELGLECFVHANGTVRLQVDLVKASGLEGFEMLFSSELLGSIKPAPGMYLRALELLRLRPEEVVLVAAHAYDLRGAKEVGIRTGYVYRWTDDILEDQEKLKGEFDFYLDGMKDLTSTVAKLMQ